MDTITKFTTPGLAFILTLIFGFWLSKAGKPYNGILFNLHKLIALGTVILTTMWVYNVVKNTAPNVLIVILIVITGICVVALFASGAFMSIGNLNYDVMRTIHNIAPVAAVMAMGLVVYLLAGRAL
jgi:hypothetical protein